MPSGFDGSTVTSSLEATRPTVRTLPRRRLEPTPTRIAGLIAAAIVVHLVVPDGHPATAVVQMAVGVSLAVIAVNAARQAHRVIRLTWQLLAGGIVAAVTADVSLTCWRLLTGSPIALPSPIHLLYLAGALATALGLITVVRPARREHAALIDAALVSLSMGAVVWPLIVRPLWDAAGSSLPRFYLTTYAVLHLAIAFGVVRLLLHRHRHHLGHWWLMGAGTIHALTATAAAVLVTTGGYVIGGTQEAGWLTAHGLVAMALPHSSAREAIVRKIAVADRATPTRAIALFAVTLLLPVAIALNAYQGRPGMLATVVAAVVALLSLRMGQLLRQISRAHHRELASQSERDQRRFSALVRHTADILLVIDPAGVVSYANPAARMLYGADPTGWTTRTIADYLHPDDRSAVVTSIMTYVDDDQRDDEPVRLHTRLAGQTGQEQYIDLVVADLTNDPDVHGVVITIQDTTARTVLERQLRHQAFHDSLTGLGNRELFRDALEASLARARQTGHQLAVLMCDLDDFKDVNDTLGHAVGDRLLTAVAQRLEATTRDSDTVARLGGDEFALIFEDVDTSRDAITLARRVLGVTDSNFQIDQHSLRVGMSIGVAIDNGTRTVEELLRDVDIALYEAKDEGKRRWAVHRPNMTERNQLRLQTADDLVVALAEQQLEVHYQPVHELPSGRLVGVEALARWRHPDRGMLAPGEFIPIAEQTGLITAVGEFVLDHAMTTLRRCTEARPGLSLRMGINVSPRELREPAIVDRVINAMRTHHIAPGSLILEITETGMLEDPSMVLGVMRQLRAHGVRFAVDDFGTGYSSLSYLRRLPVDIVKIDRSFVEELGDDPAAADLARAITDLGKTLNLDICAEGVETDRQRLMLTEFGCRFAQGFLFAHPAPADVLLERICDPQTLLVIDDASETASASPSAEDPQQVNP